VRWCNDGGWRWRLRKAGFHLGRLGLNMLHKEEDLFFILATDDDANQDIMHRLIGLSVFSFDSLVLRSLSFSCRHEQTKSLTSILHPLPRVSVQNSTIKREQRLSLRDAFPSPRETALVLLSKALKVYRWRRHVFSPSQCSLRLLNIVRLVMIGPASLGRSKYVVS
jgi:hypothetical protein